MVSSTPSRSLFVTILPPRALPTPMILPAAPPFKPTCPQTDPRPCAESACCRVPAQAGAHVRDAEERVLDARSLRVPVPYHDRAPYAEQEGTAVFLRIHRVSHPDQPRTEDPCSESAQNIAGHRRADHAEDLPRHPLGRLEHDVAREAVRYEHVSHPARDVATFHVPHEPDPRLIHKTVGLLGEVVALPRLLADVDEPDPRLTVQPEVAIREHTAKNSEIQEVLWPARDGGSRRRVARPAKGKGAPWRSPASGILRGVLS